jgi:multiple sugar transport system permease protein
VTVANSISTVQRARRRKAGRLGIAQREMIAAYCFLAPGLIMFLVFTLGPALFSLFVGFTRWNGLSQPVWTGAANYLRLAGDPRFMASLRNTALFTLMFVVVAVVTSTALAILLNRRIAGTSVIRFLWLLPFVTDMISVSMVWTWLYHFRFGVINYLIGLVGIPAQAWLGSPRLALISLVILSVWRWTGYYAIIILAGLQNVPRDLYEAATIDGASRTQTTFKITLPLLTPTIFFVVITAMMSSFQVFEQMWVMTQGGPNDSTISMAMYLYIQGFQLLDMGYASAIAWVLFLIIFVLTFVNWKIRKSWVFEE